MVGVHIKRAPRHATDVKSPLLWLTLVLLAGSLIVPTVAVSHSEISQEDYGQWKDIKAPTLSPNGKWVAYSLATIEGNTLRVELVVRAVDGEEEWHVPRGRVRHDLPELGGPGPALEPAEFTGDSRFVAFKIASDRVGDNSPGFTLGILSVADGVVAKIANVGSFELAAMSGKSLVYAMAESSDTKNSGRAGRTVIVRELDTGTEIKVPNVTVFAVDDHDQYLAYATVAQREEMSGIFTRRLSDGKVATLLQGARDYRSLAFDASGTQVAFLAGPGEGESEDTYYSVYYAPSALGAAHKVVSKKTIGDEFRIAPDAGVEFSGDSRALVIGVEPFRKETSTEGTSDAASFELWHWKDPYIVPYERWGGFSQSRPYTAVYHIEQRQFVRLGDDSIFHISVANDARYALAFDYTPYRIETTWGPVKYDVYVVDGRTGFRQPFGAEMRGWTYGRPMLSPKGRYFVYFGGRRWFSYNFAARQIADLTGELTAEVEYYTQVSRSIETASSPVGVAGWTENDGRVLVYDRNDIWALDPSGEELPLNVTDGLGRRENIIFRVWPHFGEQLNESGSERVIDARQPLLLTAIDEDTGATGLWSVRLGSADGPTRLLMLDKKVSLIGRAQGTSLLRLETYTEYSDLFVTQDLGEDLHRITNVNPQQQKFALGTAELIEWSADSGLRLKGLLYKPDNLTSEKMYPMIVHIGGAGEKFSHSLHSYDTPEPARYASINPAVFVSQGYVVFKPDIVSSAPYPGESALQSVVSGVGRVVDRGFVDSSRIGAAGHYWGGYRTAYIATHSDVFRCVAVSATPANTISDYSALRGTGRVNAFLYEYGAGLHGSSIWENPLTYIVNSPVLFADRAHGPFLIMHNDGSGPVPFAQGVELYIGLRRNAKEAYLFNYMGERLILSDYYNRLDWDKRMLEFFDRCLRNGSPVGWMEDGTRAD